MEDFTEKQLQHAYLNLVRDADFDRLLLLLNEPNIFSILSIEHIEIRHSNFLGWLLNPKENHGLNELFLKRFLREIFSDAKIKEVNALHAETLDFREVEILREWKNIDLLIKFPKLILCIENKFNSKDRLNQLLKYKEIVTEEFPESEFKNIFIYLTPLGDASSQEQDVYVFVSYQVIVDILDRVLEVYKGLLPTRSVIYIKDYIRSLKRNIMRTDLTNNLARDIYRNHQRILDFIIENRPDSLDVFSKTVEEFLVNKGFEVGYNNKGIMIFINSTIKNLLPIYNPDGLWSLKEAFIFELDFRSGKRLKFKASVSPEPSNLDYKTKLAEILEKDEKIKRVEGSWQVFLSYETTLDVKKVILENPENFNSKLELFWSKISPLILRVENIMKVHKRELMALKKEFKPKKRQLNLF